MKKKMNLRAGQTKERHRRFKDKEVKQGGRVRITPQARGGAP